MNQKFQRMIEDFICDNCGERVTGSGYTNHCPACLWSKHVDVNPGDRAEDCGGMMPPISVEGRGSRYRIQHKCLLCGTARWNKTTPQDDFEALLKISAKQGKP